MKGWIVVLAKAPRPGRVKTRMTPPLSTAEAAALYTCLLDDILELTARAAARLGLRPLLAVHPPEATVELARRAPSGFCAVPQRGADLGQRMSHLVKQAAAAGGVPVLLRSSDSPTLDEETIGVACDALAKNDLVVCPDRDGGYGLIGMHRPIPGLFDRPTSTPTLLAETLAYARSVGLRVRVLSPQLDLDTIEDLRHLERLRRSGAALPCPRTLAFLARRSDRTMTAATSCSH